MDQLHITLQITTPGQPAELLARLRMVLESDGTTVVHGGAVRPAARPVAQFKRAEST